MISDPTAVVEAYFSRVRTRDRSIVELFHDDARLVGLGSVTTGKPAILEFYEGVLDGARPSPTLVGELLTSGSRVAAEIRIEIPGGGSLHAIDLFEVEEGRIRSLTYFLADHPID